MTFKQPAAVLWDMDGTLADTEPHWLEAQSGLLERRGLPTLTERQKLELVGASAELAVRMFRSLGVTDAVHEIMAEIMAEVTESVARGVSWRPGAVELVRELNEREIPVALVTNSNRALATTVIDQLEGAFFNEIVTQDDVRPGKPDPAPFVYAAEKLGVDARECLVIEDSMNGIRGALAAGSVVLGVPHGMPLAPSEHYALRASLVEMNWDALVKIFRDFRSAQEAL